MELTIFVLVRLLFVSTCIDGEAFSLGRPVNILCTVGPQCLHLVTIHHGLDECIEASQDAKEIYFLASTAWWRPIFYIINIWKETGWGTIIFLATLAGINPELYEAADIDGATRMQKMRFVTLPALSNTIITVLILNLAKVMNMFESVFVLYNNAVYSVSDVISTYIYRQTFAIALPNYGYSTAVGLFKSLVGCVLVLICNWASKKTRGRGIV